MGLHKEKMGLRQLSLISEVSLISVSLVSVVYCTLRWSLDAKGVVEGELGTGRESEGQRQTTRH